MQRQNRKGTESSERGCVGGRLEVEKRELWFQLTAREPIWHVTGFGLIEKVGTKE